MGGGDGAGPEIGGGDETTGVRAQATRTPHAISPRRTMRSAGLFRETRICSLGPGQCFVRGRTGGGEMAHLPARASSSLAIEMQPDSWFTKNSLECRRAASPQVAGQVHECRRPEYGRIT